MKKQSKTKVEEIDLTALKGTKKSSTVALLGIMVFAFAAMTMILYSHDQNEIRTLTLQMQNVTNKTAQLDTWAQYFSPAAINAVNALAAQQQNMTGRIMRLELKNGIIPPELVNQTAK